MGSYQQSVIADTSVHWLVGKKISLLIQAVMNRSTAPSSMCVKFTWQLLHRLCIQTPSQMKNLF